MQLMSVLVQHIYFVICVVVLIFFIWGSFADMILKCDQLNH